MQNGDLSNSVTPRILLVFEGALGYLEKDDGRGFSRAIRRGQWGDAVNLWKLHQLTAQKIWDVTVRQSIGIEIVTFFGAEFGGALEYRLQVDDDLPVRGVMATTPDRLARKIAYMPSLAAVYDPDPSRWLTYGGKGRHLTDPNQLNGQ